MIDRIIYMFWTGDEELGQKRLRNYHITKESNKNLEIKFLFRDQILDYELQTNKFHRCYRYLSSTQKNDYLKAYFMNFYGGGYTDVKINYESWDRYFNILEMSDKEIIGYQEDSYRNIAIPPNDYLAQYKIQNYYRLIGNGAYICKKNTFLTNKWLENIHETLDRKEKDLRNNPASFSRDCLGAIKPDGNISKYPIRWAELCGEIFHDLVFKFNDRIMAGLPAPNCYDYR